LGIYAKYESQIQGFTVYSSFINISPQNEVSKEFIATFKLLFFIDINSSEDEETQLDNYIESIGSLQDELGRAGISQEKRYDKQGVYEPSDQKTVLIKFFEGRKYGKIIPILGQDDDFTLRDYTDVKAHIRQVLTDLRCEDLPNATLESLSNEISPSDFSETEQTETLSVGESEQEKIETPKLFSFDYKKGIVTLLKEKANSMTFDEFTNGYFVPTFILEKGNKEIGKEIPSLLGLKPNADALQIYQKLRKSDFPKHPTADITFSKQGETYQDERGNTFDKNEFAEKVKKEVRSGKKVAVAENEGKGADYTSERGLDQYFTPSWICELMWDIAFLHGFKENGTVFEPSVGNGRFLEFNKSFFESNSQQNHANGQ
jgi:hypothetical protein